MKVYRCVIIDDEPPAIELLEKYLSQVKGFEVVRTFQTAVDAFSFLAEEKIDLMFLDIRMPLLNGLDFLKTLSEPPAVILSTAYREYALDSYELDIVDYLLKPVPFQRFLQALNRFRKRAGELKTIPVLATEKTRAFLFFNINKTHYKVFLQDIYYLESLKDYVRLHTQQGELVVKGNIGVILKRLPATSFVRTHRSFAVNLKYVSAYNQTEVKVREQQLPLGGSYREDFFVGIKEI